MKLSKGFIVGLIGGVFLTLTFSLIVRGFNASGGREVIAQIGGDTLTRSELRKISATDLVPIENDEYRVLEKGLNEWLDNRLVAKEAKAKGMTVEELYQKEIWGRVQVSYGDLTGYYNKTKELYNNEPFEKVSPQISQELRRVKYAEVKDEYLKELQKKHNVKIYLKKPKSYIEGLALPSAVPIAPSPAPAGALPSVAPSPGAPSPMPFIPGKSAIGAPPVRGPENAPITMTEFSDFHCPFCKKVTPTLEQLMQKYQGKIKWIFRHNPLPMHQGADKTSEAAVCAQEQGKFWEFHDAVYVLPGAPQPNDLQTIAQNVGLDTKKFQDCLSSGKYKSVIQQDMSEASQKGVRGTPTVFVNNQMVAGAYPIDYFSNIIDALLSGKTPPPAPSAQAPPAPTGPVSFDDLDGRPTTGPKNAPITLVEFSDFHCPFCKRVEPAVDQLMKNYSGKIRRFWRQYPLPMHAGADRTAEASECANEQGKFWEYHGKLFETQGSPRDDATLGSLAEQAGLNKKKFEKCLTGGKYKEVIQKDIAKGNQVGVRGTPAIFINGKLVSGAQPYENFDQIVKTELSSKS